MMANTLHSPEVMAMALKLLLQLLLCPQSACQSCAPEALTVQPEVLPITAVMAMRPLPWP